MRRIIFYAMALAALAFVACDSGRHTDSRLDRVDELTSSSAREALDSLAAIDYAPLAPADRHYYDLLSVKAADKAYIEHNSDSLILDVIDFYDSHRGSGHYAEALYYGGRVYCEMGDYPTALKYFQDALDRTPIESDVTLRGNILSQIGWLLNQLYLYSKSICYLKEVLAIDSIENNRVNLAYDNHLIGTSYLKLNNVDSAEYFFTIAKQLAMDLSKNDQANMDIYLARANMYRHKLDSAVSYIRHAPKDATPLYKNIALINASEIYFRAGKLDTAFLYANELVHTDDINNHKAGYHILLSPDLLPYIPSDSLPTYFRRYYYILEDYYDKHESQLALLQETSYNYDLHVRQRLNAEMKQQEFFIWWCIAIIVALNLLLIALFYRIRSRQALVRLNLALNKITLLQQMISSRDKKDKIKPAPMTSTELRQRIDEMIKDIESTGNAKEVKAEISQSAIYAELIRCARDQRCLVDNNPIWKNLFDMIEEVSPQFYQRINMLAGIEIKLHEKQTLTLLKCGLSLKEMGHLLSKSKATMYSRRRALCRKLIGEMIDLSKFDILIQRM